jgi:effector-binding domain-containing protein
MNKIDLIERKHIKIESLETNLSIDKVIVEKKSGKQMEAIHKGWIESVLKA